MTTIEALAEFLGDRRGGDVEGDAGRRRTTAPSCSRSSAATTGSSERSSSPRSAERPPGDRGRDPRGVRRRSAARSARSASTGEVVADETLREGQFVAGANRDGWHLRGVEAGRDFEPRFADLRVPVEGDRCPSCGGELRFQTAIEVGHIFKLGTHYSVPLEATFLDEDGKEKPLVMGSYGIGPGRIMAAAVEQRHDDERASAGRRRSRRTTCTWSRCPASRSRRARPRRRCPRRAPTCCSTTATLRAGEKFADADLIGLPVRVTVGQEDPRGREGRRPRPRSGDEKRVEVCELGKELFDGKKTEVSARSRSARRSSG